MKKLYVRFLFKNGPHILDVCMSELDARNVVNSWRTAPNGELKGYDSELQHNWSVLTSEIACAFTFDPDFELVKQQQAQQRAQQQR